jgi:hypothetical protein
MKIMFHRPYGFNIWSLYLIECYKLINYTSRLKAAEPALSFSLLSFLTMFSFLVIILHDIFILVYT